ncbi:MAG TPA: hypothetical protein VHI13_03730 [Candidatus Kapabacteria bacterium]|nr:hypothetical protein [Candidatus Kapabacteria bacterium]
MKTISTVLALATLAAATAMAQVPRTINYQGRIKGASGLLQGSHSMRLRLYTQASGGTAIFDETQDANFTDGIFTVAIGGGTTGGIPATIPFDRQLWMGVAIDGRAELSPRFILRSSPYSLRAAGADSAARAHDADSAATAASAVTATYADTAHALATPAVINGGKTQIGLAVKGTPFAVVSNGNDSTSGHVIVGDTAGNSAAPVAGALYRDNSAIAWGQIGIDGNIAADFGITSVAIVNGTYEITLDNSARPVQGGSAQFPEIAPSITIGGQTVDTTPAIPTWTFRRNQATGVYDENVVVVRIENLQGNTVLRPFSIVVFGRPAK